MNPAWFRLETSGILEEVCPDCRGIDDTTWAAQTEQGGIGSALDVDTVRIEGIKRHVGLEEVSCQVSCGQTTDTRETARRIIAVTFRNNITGAGILGSGKVTAQSSNFRIRGQHEDILEVGGTGILQ